MTRLRNLWRPVLPVRVGSWPLTSLQQRLVKTGGRLGAMVRRIWALPVPAG